MAAMRSDSLRRTLAMPVIVTGDVAKRRDGGQRHERVRDVAHVDGEAGGRSRAGHPDARPARRSRVQPIASSTSRKRDVALQGAGAVQAEHLRRGLP